MRIKRTCIFIFIIFTIFLISGCTENKQEKKYIEQAKINALEYIKKKYNFDAKVIDTESIYKSMAPVLPTYGLSDYVNVKLKANDKIFFVQIIGNKPSDDGRDNYQYKEISNDILDLIKQDFKDIYKYDIDYGFDINEGEKGTKKGLIKEYYNGNNLYDIVDHLNIRLDFIGTKNFENLNFNDYLKELNFNDMNVVLNSFKSKNNYKKYYNKTDNYLSYIDSKLNYWKINDKTKIVYYNYKDYLYKIDDMYIYALLKNQEYTTEKNINKALIPLSIKKSKTNWYNHENISETLLIESNTSDIYQLNIAIPKNKKYNKYRNKNVIGLYSMVKYGECINFEDFTESGNYYISKNYNPSAENNYYLSITHSVEDYYRDECH